MLLVDQASGALQARRLNTPWLGVLARRLNPSVSREKSELTKKIQRTQVS